MFQGTHGGFDCRAQVMPIAFVSQVLFAPFGADHLLRRESQQVTRISFLRLGRAAPRLLEGTGRTNTLIEAGLPCARAGTGERNRLSLWAGQSSRLPLFAPRFGGVVFAQIKVCQMKLTRIGLLSANRGLDQLHMLLAKA